MMNFSKLLVAMVSLLAATTVRAGDLSYDLGGSSGTQNNVSYTEINLGLNYYVVDWLNWRNAVFTRFGTNVDSVSGLDSSLRATYTARSNDGGLGFQIFAGPGVRIANNNNSGGLAEAGVLLQLGGLVLGGGARYLSYFNDRKDTYAGPLAKSETQYFIILGGGGSL